MIHRQMPTTVLGKDIVANGHQLRDCLDSIVRCAEDQIVLVIERYTQRSPYSCLMNDVVSTRHPGQDVSSEWAAMHVPLEEFVYAQRASFPIYSYPVMYELA